MGSKKEKQKTKRKIVPQNLFNVWTYETEMRIELDINMDHLILLHFNNFVKTTSETSSLRAAESPSGAPRTQVDIQ